MKQKHILLYSLVTALIYSISDIAYVRGELDLYFNNPDRYYTVADIIVTFITVNIALLYIKKWNITSKKEAFLTHTLSYTVIASILATVASYFINEMFFVNDKSLTLTFFLYLNYKFFESCFFELFRTRLMEQE